MIDKSLRNFTLASAVVNCQSSINFSLFAIAFVRD
jgi:hypothetical protein